eukprot:2558830-Pyramimonas_sp.AAC.1
MRRWKIYSRLDFADTADWQPTANSRTIDERPTATHRLLSTLGRSQELGETKRVPTCSEQVAHQKEHYT